MEKRWSNSTKYLVVGIILFGFGWLAYSNRDLIGPLIISFLLAYLLNPLVTLITTRTSLSRNLASLLAYLAFIGVVFGIPIGFTPSIIRQILEFQDDMVAVLAGIQDFIQQPIVLGGFTFLPPEQFIISFEEEIRSFIGSVSSGAINSLSGLSTNFLWLLIIFVTTYYLLRDGPRLRIWMVRLAPESFQSDVDRLIGEIDKVWSAFLRGQVILVISIGLLTGISSALLGLRGAIMVGIIAGILDLIPTLGPVVGGAIAVLLAFIFGSDVFQISNFWFGMIVAGVFAVIQQIENIWIAPQVLGRELKMHPGLIFVGVIGSLALVGILGALVIVPLMASAAILGRYIHALLQDKDPWQMPMPVQKIPSPLKKRVSRKDAGEEGR